MGESDRKEGETVQANKNKLTRKVRMRIVELLEDGSLIGLAAKEVGVTRQAVWKAMNRNSMFKEACEIARGVADDAVEMSLYRLAIGSATTAQNTVACIFLLKNRRPLEWRDAHIIDINKLSGDQIEFTASYADGEPVPSASLPVSAKVDG